MFAIGRRKVADLMGVTITAQSCAAAVVSRQGGARPRLVHCRSDTPGDRADAKQRWLRTLRHEVGAKRLPVAACLEPGRYATALIELPVMPAPERHRAARWRIKDVLDFDVDEAVVDVAEVPTPDGASARRYFAFAAHANDVDELAAGYRAAGLRLARLGVPEFALRNLAAEMPEDHAGLAIVYFDPDSMVVVVTREQTLCVARRVHNEVLARARSPAADGERQQALIEALVLELLRTLDFYEGRFRAPAVATVVFVPCPGVPPRVLEAVQDQLEVSCRVLDLAAIFDLDSSLDDEQTMRCAIAIGAALSDGGVPA